MGLLRPVVRWALDLRFWGKRNLAQDFRTCVRRGRGFARGVSSFLAQIGSGDLSEYQTAKALADLRMIIIRLTIADTRSSQGRLRQPQFGGGRLHLSPEPNLSVRGRTPGF